ncbi:hypothetical protein ACIBAI_07250 [Streptomyces sp. NPDC051041]|uniref:hypothetical protein n=1 Tax=Streptomyces sp. NPDC051041 TaxID=3365640 RepID=UPI0037A19899
MKKRSMLAIASLATGFVVAAVTPSHALTGPLGGVDVDRTVGDLGRTVAADGLPLDHSAPDGQRSGQGD